jgi:hypothetical protein
MVQEEKTGGNGFDPEGRKKLQATLDNDIFDTAFTQQHIAGAIEKFVDRGEKVEDLLLRAHFRDVNHKNACIRLLRKAKHFKDTELEEAILNSIAGDPAIQGLRIDILLQAVTGYLHEKRKNDMGGRLRELFGIKDKDNANKPG